MPKNQNEHQHNHDHDHDCECGHEEEQETIVLLDDEGHEHRFTVVDILDVDEQSYAVLAPEEPEDGEEDEAYIFRIESHNGEEQLVTVDDDEEFERVAAALAELDEGWDEQEDVTGDEEDD